MSQQYALEWSQSTNNFHLQPLANLLAMNQEAFISNKPPKDFVVLMVGEKDAVERMADHWRIRIAERDRVRNAPKHRSLA